MDRSIPHVRDIFSRKQSSDSQQLCLYDKSPRSRRKLKSSDDFLDHGRGDSTPTQPPPPSGNRKKTTCSGDKENHKSKPSPEESKNDSDRRHSNRKNNNSYSSKTLTERDIRHLERHLSMKKTIRKQISRNLAQAFVDDPSLFSNDNSEPTSPPPAPVAPKSPEKKVPGGRGGGGITLTRAKIAKSEQNVLDLLKVSIEDRDSGHSSPTNDALEDDDEDYDGASAAKGWRSTMKRRSSQTKTLTEGHPKDYSGEKKSSSIWKMFSSRSKGKR